MNGGDGTDDGGDGAQILGLPIDLGRRVGERRMRDVHDPQRCDHAWLSIDLALRTVACKRCERDVDPIDALAQIAHARRAELGWASQRKQEAEDAQQRLEALKREERKVRARLRTARAQDPVEAYKRDLLDRVARGVDLGLQRIASRGPGPGLRTDGLLEQLRAVEYICESLLGPNEPLRRKIKAAIEELDARRRREALHVVKPKDRGRDPTPARPIPYE